MPAPRRFTFPEPEDLTIVVRAAGERTEDVLVEQLTRQLPNAGAQLTVLHEKPFSQAVRRTFEIGAASARPWLIAVDADVLLLDDAVVRIREICGKMDPRAFVATPLFLCRMTGGLATRALHCYRGPLLGEAIRAMDETPMQIRPESRVHDAMTARGWTRECYAKPFGLHEYEQSFRHVYLKAMLRARKDEFADDIRRRLAALASTHPDFLVASWGFADARDDDPVEYDWETPYPKLDERLAAHGLTEKPTLTRDAVGEVRARILAHEFRRDRQTLAWIRELLDFDGDAPELRRYLAAAPDVTSGRTPQRVAG